MKIRVTHEATTIVVDEAIDPGFANSYGVSHPTKIRFTDDHPYVMKTLEKMADEVIRIRKADSLPNVA